MRHDVTKHASCLNEKRYGFLTWSLLAFLVALTLTAVPAIPAQAGTIDLKSTVPDYQLFGENEDDLAGQTVVFTDVNGDGQSDFVIGARGVDYLGRSSCGAIYIVLSSDTLTSPIDLASDRPDLKRIYGPAANSQIGSRLACGDVNNDGRWDIICGMPTASPNGKFSAGEVIVIFGSDEPADVVDLLNPPAGVTRIQGENTFDKLGESVAVGDVNDDTYGDILAGASFATAVGRQFAGAVFVIHGSENLDATIDLSATTSPVTRIFGARANDTFGTACFAADVTDDSIADILAGAPQATVLGRSAAGVGYLIPGSASLPDTIDTLENNGDGIVRILGATPDALAGAAFSSGDADGDDIADLFIACPGLSPDGRTAAGAVYLLGGAETRPDTIDLASPPAMTTRIDGPASNLKIGQSLTAGDFNFDGIDDVVIGVPKASPFDVPTPRTEAGTVYIVFGRGIFPDRVDLAVEQTGITTILGAVPLDNTGNSVAVGRLNADGFDDLLIGANNARLDGSFSVGRAIVFLGNADITPTQVVFYDAVAEHGSVRLEWLLRDDLDIGNIRISRSERAGAQTRVLPSKGLRRLDAGHFAFEDNDVRGGLTYTYTVSAGGADPQLFFSISVSVPALGRAVLHPNAPNPFRDWTAFSFEIPNPGRVTIRVFDVSGAFVDTVTDANFGAGPSSLRWDGRNRNGRLVPTGVYFVRMSHEGQTILRKMTIVR